MNDKSTDNVPEIPDELLPDPHDVDMGVSIGRYETEQEVFRAVKLGLLDEWIDYHLPRTWRQWEEFHRTHPVKDKDMPWSGKGKFYGFSEWHGLPVEDEDDEDVDLDDLISGERQVTESGEDSSGL